MLHAHFCAIFLQLSDDGSLATHSKIKLKRPSEPTIIESNYSLQDDAILDLAKKDLVNMMKLKVGTPHAFIYFLNGPHCDKTCLPGFRQSETQTSLLSYRD